MAQFLKLRRLKDGVIDAYAVDAIMHVEPVPAVIAQAALPAQPATPMGPGGWPPAMSARPATAAVAPRAESAVVHFKGSPDLPPLEVAHTQEAILRALADEADHVEDPKPDDDDQKEVERREQAQRESREMTARASRAAADATDRAAHDAAFRADQEREQGERNERAGVGTATGVREGDAEAQRRYGGGQARSDESKGQQDQRDPATGSVKAQAEESPEEFLSRKRRENEGVSNPPGGSGETQRFGVGAKEEEDRGLARTQADAAQRAREGR